MSAPISGGDIISDVVRGVGKTVAPLTASLQQWLSSAAGAVGSVSNSVGGYIPPPFAMLLFALLFVHFLAYTIETNTKLQKSWPALAASMHELRNNLAMRVIGGANGLVYWGSFVLGASVGATSGSYAVDSGMAMYTAMFLLLVWVVNQVCLAMTMTYNRSISDLGVDGFPGSYVANANAGGITGEAGSLRKPLLTMTKGRPIYLVVAWLQAVTDILFSRSIPGLIYGYGLGKLVSFAK